MQDDRYLTMLSKNAIIQKVRVIQMVAGALCSRGKSELQRAGRWVTPSDSATEIDCRFFGDGGKVR